MVYKGFKRNLKEIILLSLICSVLYSCSENNKEDIANIYFIDFVNFNDSLEQYLANGIIGKISFLKNKEIQIISINYKTHDYSDIHYFKSIKEITEKVKPGSQKIKVEQVGNYSEDSINYGLQKFRYENSNWKKISDIGTIKVYSNRRNPKKYNTKELVNSIIKNLVQYSY